MKFSEWLELREEKDACYHKVKATASVWPSAYGSGRLVQCRKKGAKNWGKSKKKKNMHSESVEINERLADLNQYSDAQIAVMALMYKGFDASLMSSQEIIKALGSIGKTTPENVSPILYPRRQKTQSPLGAGMNGGKITHTHYI